MVPQHSRRQGSNSVVVNTSASNFLTFNGIQNGSGTTNALCTDSSNNVVYCNSAPFGLQAVYNAGNTITTTNARDISFTLAATSTNSNFTVTTANGSTGSSIFSLAAGANTTVPSQEILINNANTTNALPSALKVTSTGGGAITTGIDLSDVPISSPESILEHQT